jgi:hypothetical protein
MKNDLKKVIRSNKCTSGMYNLLRSRKNSDKIKLYNEEYINPVNDNLREYRVNLVLPHMMKFAIFGGISTALNFFDKVCENFDCKMRIIVVDNGRYIKSATYQYKDFSPENAQNNLHICGENANLPVAENDIFICTSWITALYIYPVYEWQKKQFNISNRKLIYLIQDFEPGFFAWSTEYVLAESTYRHGENLIAVFNSEELSYFFDNKGYKFFRSIYFKPCLSPKLKLLLEKGSNIKRKKQILIYGRPLDDRNCFNLIYTALWIWSEKYNRAKEWSIISLGDKFTNIKLKNNTINFGGKVSLEKYAETMFESYVGISLMESPHPSYPPLEMSTFGVRTITNIYENKNLDGFNENIISLTDYNPKKIAETLAKVCDEYGTLQAYPILDNEYVNEDSFSDAVMNVKKIICEIEDI